MKFADWAENPLRFATSCLVVPLWQDEPLSGTAEALDRALGGLVREVIEIDGFKASTGETRVLYGGARGESDETLAAPRAIVVGLGKRDKASLSTMRKSAARAARAVRALQRADFALALPAVPGALPEEVAAASVEGIELGLHQFNDFKTDPELKKQTHIENVTLLAEAGAETLRLEGAVAAAQTAVAANLRARLWVNLPSNRKSPAFLADRATDIASDSGLRCEIWDEKRISEEGMNALAAVGMGSDNPPRFIVLEYAPAGHENDKPLVLVGKGMTFDTGGYSIKPAQSMEDMKDDMGGAAAVLGTMSALRDAGVQRRVFGIVASAENMINGHAMRPGDIVTARNGKTIEILNTDAEGRLILADALSYACELDPEWIVDLATLTGAIGIALGQEAAGLFANDDELAAALTAAGEATGERLWRFPLWDEYRDHIKGTVSDIKNIGIERRAGSIAAAVFLERFVRDGVKWAHLDIAAVALLREERPLVQRGATGFGVRLLLELFKNL